MLPCFGKREMSESPTALRSAKEVQEPEIHPRRALLREWARTGNFVAAHHALEYEFTVASVIKARGDADKTQEGVAKAMGTTQAVVARLESGRPWLRPAH